ncbi:hypothetical protein HN011_012541 [Eciton burchellii]|nr:hypothetical protein HN011_012541 [Eciton burchellii]
MLQPIFEIISSSGNHSRIRTCASVPEILMFRDTDLGLCVSRSTLKYDNVPLYVRKAARRKEQKDLTMNASERSRATATSTRRHGGVERDLDVEITEVLVMRLRVSDIPDLAPEMLLSSRRGRPLGTNLRDVSFRVLTSFR